MSEYEYVTPSGCACPSEPNTWSGLSWCYLSDACPRSKMQQSTGKHWDWVDMRRSRRRPKLPAFERKARSEREAELKRLRERKGFAPAKIALARAIEEISPAALARKAQAERKKRVEQEVQERKVEEQRREKKAIEETKAKWRQLEAEAEPVVPLGPLPIERVRVERATQRRATEYPFGPPEAAPELTEEEKLRRVLRGVRQAQPSLWGAGAEFVEGKLEAERRFPPALPKPVSTIPAAPPPEVKAEVPAKPKPLIAVTSSDRWQVRFSDGRWLPRSIFKEVIGPLNTPLTPELVERAFSVARSRFEARSVKRTHALPRPSKRSR